MNAVGASRTSSSPILYLLPFLLFRMLISALLRAFRTAFSKYGAALLATTEPAAPISLPTIGAAKAFDSFEAFFLTPL